MKRGEASLNIDTDTLVNPRSAAAARTLARSGIAGCALAGAALAGVAARAADYDPLGIAGDVNDTVNSVVIYPVGGAPLTVHRCIPWLLPSGSSGQNGAVVQVVNGKILGAVTTFSTAGNPNLVAYFGCASDPSCGLVSNNVVIDEFPDNRSNTLGDILPDGSIVYRANFAGTGQNNLELVKGDVCAQVALPPTAGAEILSGACTSGGTTTNCQLSVPAAMADGDDAGFVWVADANFDAAGTNVPTGVNVWRYPKGGPAQPISAPNYTYLQSDATTWAGTHGVVITAANTRQTAPVLKRVNGVDYVLFGVGDSTFPASGTAGATGGGSGGRRPRILCLDVFEDGDGFAGAVALLPPAGYMFVDHQATGGGAGNDAFNNKKFDMNSKGELVVVAETTEADPALRTAAVLRYAPVFTAGRISGFLPHPVRHRIADGGPLGDPDDVVADGLAGGIPLIPPIVGAGINDAGNVAFTANYRSDPLDPSVTSTAVYFYCAPQDALHQITRQLDVVGAGPMVEIGLFTTRDSDGFSAPGLADNADVVAACFRDTPDLVIGSARGVIVMSVVKPACPGDLDGDGDTDQSDLGILLASYEKDGGGDLDGDGDTDQADLGILLADYNCTP